MQGGREFRSARRRVVISSLESISPSSVHSGDLLFVLLLLLPYHTLSTLCSISVLSSGATGPTEQTLGLGKHDFKGGGIRLRRRRTFFSASYLRRQVAVRCNAARRLSRRRKVEDEIFIRLSPPSRVLLCVVILFCKLRRRKLNRERAGESDEEARANWHARDPPPWRNPNDRRWCNSGARLAATLVA